jgi:hypothetical protein
MEQILNEIYNFNNFRIWTDFRISNFKILKKKQKQKILKHKRNRKDKNKKSNRYTYVLRVGRDDQIAGTICSFKSRTRGRDISYLNATGPARFGSLAIRGVRVRS